MRRFVLASCREGVPATRQIVRYCAATGAVKRLLVSFPLGVRKSVIMLTFFYVRLESMRLANSLRQSLLDEGEAWTVENDHDRGASIASGKFRIALTPRAMRLFDRINLYCDGAAVWLPLISRIRLRNAVRLLVTRHADMLWLRQTQEQAPQKHARSA